jgi:hypothetical protein
MKISLDRIKENIQTRRKEIVESRKGIINFLTLNKKMQVVVDPDLAQEASEFMTWLEGLKKANQDDIAYIAHVIATCRKNDIPCSDSEMDVNLDQMKADLKKQLEAQLVELKNKLIAGAVTGTEYDELLARLKVPIETRIAELTAIESELSIYRKNQGGENQ